MLKEKLIKEINSYNDIEPNVQLFVDESAIFWVSNDGDYVYVESHPNINDYIDDNHQIEELNTPEGVGSYGVFWMNKDFESPFHISDFTDQIETITV